MDTITLDGALLAERTSAMDHLTEALSLPDWWGRNLDALYDLLTDQGSGWQVTFLHTEETDTLLPAYMASLRRLCRRAMAETPGLTVDFQE